MKLGIPYAELHRTSLGRALNFIDAYNEMMSDGDGPSAGGARMATQADIDSMLA